MNNVDEHLRGDQNLDDLHKLSHLLEVIAIHRASRQEQRSDETLVLSVHVRAVFHQSTHDVGMIILHRLVQGCPPPAHGQRQLKRRKGKGRRE